MAACLTLSQREPPVLLLDGIPTTTEGNQREPLRILGLVKLTRRGADLPRVIMLELRFGDKEKLEYPAEELLGGSLGSYSEHFV